MGINFIDLVGTVAAICTTVAFVPQVVRVYRTRHARDLSMSTYLIFAFGVFAWTYYGILTKSRPIIFANIATFMLCLYIIAMKLKYK